MSVLKLKLKNFIHVTWTQYCCAARSQAKTLCLARLFSAIILWQSPRLNEHGRSNCSLIVFCVDRSNTSTNDEKKSNTINCRYVNAMHDELRNQSIGQKLSRTSFTATPTVTNALYSSKIMQSCYTLNSGSLKK